ncbi:MAG: TIGR03936 family radical SAM-associated protein [Oscillospiraceae bacterium]|nr:TIGR03936 family radical SAM-associated protein [Oscillospiraceae bacterium]
MRVRFTYARGDAVCYISHLDIMRTFERAFRRARVPVATTAGYNPRVRLVFALPMQTGVVGTEEVGEVTLAETVGLGPFMDSVNGALPEGMRLTACREADRDIKLMSAVWAADYAIEIRPPGLPLAEAVAGFMAGEGPVRVMKRGKAGDAPTDVRPFVIAARSDPSTGTVEARLRAGTVNLKPTLFVEALQAHAGLEGAGLSGLAVRRVVRGAIWGEAPRTGSAGAVIGDAFQTPPLVRLFGMD